MSNILCKIFRFFLDIFEKVVEVVASAIKTIGTAVVDVLGTLLQAAGSALSELFSGSGVLGLVAGGLLLWWLMKEDDKEEDAPIRSVDKPENAGAINV